MSGKDIREASGKLMEMVQSAAVLSVLAVADRAELLKHLAKAGPLTPRQVAERSGCVCFVLVQSLSVSQT